MAAVEKRKNVWLAFLYNHLMFMVICLLTVTMLKGVFQLILGALLSFIYYAGIYDYAKKASREHSSGRYETQFSWKFPLYYALVGNFYFWIGVIINIIGSAIFPAETIGYGVSFIAYFVWDSPFIFLSAFSGDNLDKLNLLPLIVFPAMFFASTFLGYFMGKYEKAVKKFMSKFRKNKTVRKALR